MAPLLGVWFSCNNKISLHYLGGVAVTILESESERLFVKSTVPKCSTLIPSAWFIACHWVKCVFSESTHGCQPKKQTQELAINRITNHELTRRAKATAVSFIRFPSFHSRFHVTIASRSHLSRTERSPLSRRAQPKKTLRLRRVFPVAGFRLAGLWDWG